MTFVPHMFTSPQCNRCGIIACERCSEEYNFVEREKQKIKQKKEKIK